MDGPLFDASTLKPDENFGMCGREKMKTIDSVQKIPRGGGEGGEEWNNCRIFLEITKWKVF